MDAPIQRFNAALVTGNWPENPEPLVRHHQGDYVLYQDHLDAIEQLKQENAELKEKLARAEQYVVDAFARIDDLKSQLQQRVPDDLLAWCRQAQRLMRATGELSGWQQTADDLESLIATKEPPELGCVFITGEEGSSEPVNNPETEWLVNTLELMIEAFDTKLIICPCCDQTATIEHGCDAEEYRCIICGICGGEMEEA